MKQLWRSAIILAAGLVIVVGLVAAGAITQGRRGLAAQPAVDGALVSLRPQALWGGGVGNAASTLFGLRVAASNTVIVVWVTMVGVLVLRWLRSRRGRGSP